MANNYDNRSGDKKDFRGKPAFEEKKSFGDKKPYEGKKSFGDKPTFGEKRSFGDKKPYEGKKSFGDRPAFGEKKSFGDKKPYEGKKSFSDRPAFGEKKSFGDKKPYEGKKSFGDRPAFGEKRSFGSKKPYETERPQRKPRPEEEAVSIQESGTDEQPFLVIGRNAVREAIKSGRSLNSILVSKNPDGSLREIVNLAKDARILVREVDRSKLDELCMPFGHGGKTANHQGVAAYAAGVTYCEVEDILKAAKEKGEVPFIIVLDGVEDPHNLGSILRSADCAGAHGVIIGKRRSAAVTATVVKVSAGAAEHVPVARVVNVPAALEILKRNHVWIAGADMNGVSCEKQDLSGALALVIGSEGNGLSQLVREKCDFAVSIPIGGHVGSLNASVAAAVLMFEKKRQDALKL
jgi:23S rRNA (guanosine2251-2'-O)-methyltransferase